MTVYRGGVGQWSWALHRITGVGVLIFLCLHILDTALIVLGPDHYNAIIALYRHPAFKVMEVGLVACVLFHALNGVRILLIDFHPSLTWFHARMFAVQMALFLLILLPVGYVMLRHLVGR